MYVPVAAYSKGKYERLKGGAPVPTYSKVEYENLKGGRIGEFWPQLLDRPHSNLVCAKVLTWRGGRLVPERHRVRGYGVWLTESDLETGGSPWLLSPTFAVGFEVTKGVRFEMDEHSLKILRDANARTRTVVLYPPKALQEEISTGRSGPFRPTLLTQRWSSYLPKGAELKVAESPGVKATPVTLRHDVVSLEVEVGLSNVTSEACSTVLDLHVAPRHRNTLLCALYPLGAELPTNRAPDFAAVTLAGHSTTNIQLHTPLSPLSMLRAGEDLRVVSLDHGWELPLTPLPKDVELLKNAKQAVAGRDTQEREDTVMEVETVSVWPSGNAELPARFNNGRSFVISLNVKAPNAEVLKKNLIANLKEKKLGDRVVLDWFSPDEPPEFVEAQFGSRVPLGIAQCVVKALYETPNIRATLALKEADEYIATTSLGGNQKVYIGGLRPRSKQAVTQETLRSLLNPGMTLSEFHDIVRRGN
jgi:hypothetical protein